MADGRLSKWYLVTITRSETLRVDAVSEEEAENLALQGLGDFYDAETHDVQVEEDTG